MNYINTCLHFKSFRFDPFSNWRLDDAHFYIPMNSIYELRIVAKNSIKKKKIPNEA